MGAKVNHPWGRCHLTLSLPSFKHNASHAIKSQSRAPKASEAKARAVAGTWTPAVAPTAHSPCPKGWPLPVRPSVLDGEI